MQLIQNHKHFIVYYRLLRIAKFIQESINHIIRNHFRNIFICNFSRSYIIYTLKIRTTKWLPLEDLHISILLL